MAISEGRRIAVILDPDVDAALSAIAVGLRKPVASLVRSYLRDALPAFQVMAQALSVVAEGPERAVQMMVDHADQAVADVQQLVLPMRRKRGRKPKG